MIQINIALSDNVRSSKLSGNDKSSRPNVFEPAYSKKQSNSVLYISSACSAEI